MRVYTIHIIEPMTANTTKTAYQPKIIESAFVDFISERVNPFWSPISTKAKLTQKLWLNDSLVALELTPNRLWLKQQARQIRQQHQLYSAHERRASQHSHWQAGQHISLSVKLDGIYHHRHYSLVGMPDLTGLLPIDPIIGDVQQPTKSHANKLMIVIKPQGRVSDYLAYEAKVGETFDIGLPEGDFTLSHHQVAADRPLGFIASGSGITPMPGLISQALHEGDATRPVTLLYYYRSSPSRRPFISKAQSVTMSSLAKSPIAISQKPAFLPYWQSLAQRYPNFHYHLIDTQDPSRYLGHSGSETLRDQSPLSRHIDEATLYRLNLSPEHCQLFACGSPAMMRHLTQLIAHWPPSTALPNTADDAAIDDCSNLSFNNTFNSAADICGDNQTSQALKSNEKPRSFLQHLAVEYFGQFADETDGTTVSAQRPPVTIQLRRRQRQLRSAPASQSILKSAEAERIMLPHGCRQGICNMCRCDKVSGVVKDLTTGKLSHDGFESIKPCISAPMSDVVLDV